MYNQPGTARHNHPAKYMLNEFTSGMLMQIAYDVERGAKPAGEVTVKKDKVSEYVSLVHKHSKTVCYIEPLDDTFSTVFIVKDPRMVALLRARPRDPKTITDHFLLGKLFGYSDDAILDWIDANEWEG